MKTLATIVSVALLGIGAALAATPQNPPHVYTRAHQPKGNPTKASSFAPQSGNKRHVYGAPIQSPILHHRPVKPATPPR